MKTVTQDSCETSPLFVSDEELYILSEGLLALIENINTARRLVPDRKSVSAMEDYATRVYLLNQKVCGVMKE